MRPFGLMCLRAFGAFDDATVDEGLDEYVDPWICWCCINVFMWVCVVICVYKLLKYTHIFFYLLFLIMKIHELS